MSTYTTYFKSGQTQASYGLNDYWAFNPDLGVLLELWDLTKVSRKSGALEATMSNGLRVKIGGEDLRYEDGKVVGGTITGVRVLTGDGKTTLSTLLKLNVDAQGFFAKADAFSQQVETYNSSTGSTVAYAFDGYRFVDWLRKGNDTLTGSDGSEGLFGGAGNDTISAGRGNDEVSGDAGRDRIDGGRGFDTLFAANTQDQTVEHGVALNVGKGTFVDEWGNTDTIKGIESFVGSVFGDTLLGGAGDEVFRGRQGADTINGGGGTDEARYDYDFDPQHNNESDEDGNDDPIGVSVNLAKNKAIDTFGYTDKLHSIENAYGGSWRDTIVGSKGDNVLGGGYSADKLTGGGGRDTFVFDNTPYDDEDADRITDFQHKDDKLQLDRTAFENLATATAKDGRKVLAEKSFAVSDSGDDGWRKDTRILYDEKHGDLYYDEDGSGDDHYAHKFAHLDGAPKVTAGDFLVV